MKLSPTLLRSAIVAGLGGLLFGFDTAVISGTTEWLKHEFILSDFMLGFTVASALIGTIIGSIAVGKPADTVGRRGVLYALAITFIVSSIGCGMAWTWGLFIAFRFIGGLAVGGASVVSPLYIAEISPARYRGRLVAITQLNIVVGILLAYLSNYVIFPPHRGRRNIAHRRQRMSLDGRSNGRAVHYFLSAAFFNAPEPPLAGRQRAGGGRADGFAAVWHRCRQRG